MTEPTPSSDVYAHLRAHAAAQKRATVDRLTRAIAELEAEHHPGFDSSDPPGILVERVQATLSGHILLV